MSSGKFRSDIRPQAAINFMHGKNMICPECKAEYRQGYTKCADCNIELVEAGSIQEEPSEPEEIALNTVMISSNQGQIAIAKSLLDSSGITYFIEGESSSSLLEATIPAMIKVPEENFEQAKEILKNLL